MSWIMKLFKHKNVNFYKIIREIDVFALIEVI